MTVFLVSMLSAKSSMWIIRARRWLYAWTSRMSHEPWWLLRLTLVLGVQDYTWNARRPCLSAQESLLLVLPYIKNVLYQTDERSAVFILSVFEIGDFSYKDKAKNAFWSRWIGVYHWLRPLDAANIRIYFYNGTQSWGKFVVHIISSAFTYTMWLPFV